jgi:PST family polysaccharide transporter
MSGTVANYEPDPSAAAPTRAGGGLREMVIRGGIALFVRQMLSMALTLVSILVITCMIGPGAYGRFAAALGIYQFFDNLAMAGIPAYLIRQPDAVSRRQYDVAASLLLMIGLALSAGLWLSAGVIASWINIGGVDKILEILAFVIPVHHLLGVAPVAFLERALDYRRVAVIELVSLFANLVVAAPLAMAGYGSWSLVYGLIAQLGTYDAMALVAARYAPRLAWDKAISRDILSYGLGVALGQWVLQLRLLVLPLIAGPFLGAAAVGQIAMAIRFAEGLSFMRGIASRLSLPALARVQSQPAKLVAAITEGLQLQMLAVAPVLLAFVWSAGWLVPLIFGERWLPSLAIYPFIALSRLTTGLFGIHLSALYVLGRNYNAAVHAVINSMLFMLGAFIFISWNGPAGYGWAELVACASFVAMHRFTRNAVGCPSYGVSTIWWVGTAIGLFSRQLGSWAIAMPFLALLWPTSLRRLKAIASEVLVVSVRSK